MPVQAVDSHGRRSNYRAKKREQLRNGSNAADDVEQVKAGDTEKTGAKERRTPGILEEANALANQSRHSRMCRMAKIAREPW